MQIPDQKLTMINDMQAAFKRFPSNIFPEFSQLLFVQLFCVVVLLSAFFFLLCGYATIDRRQVFERLRLRLRHCGALCGFPTNKTDYYNRVSWKYGNFYTNFLFFCGLWQIIACWLCCVFTIYLFMLCFRVITCCCCCCLLSFRLLRDK